MMWIINHNNFFAKRTKYTENQKIQNNFRILKEKIADILWEKIKQKIMKENLI